MNNIVTIMPSQRKPILPESGTTYNTAADIKNRIGDAFAPGSSLQLGRTLFKDEEEEKRLMSKIIGVSPIHQEFDLKVNEYWRDLSIPVPFEGLVLDITAKTDSKGNVVPVNPKDYVLYLYCKKYKDVAQESVNVDPDRYRFFIKDETAERKRVVLSARLKDKATLLKVELAKDSKKASLVLYALGVIDLPDMNDEEVIYVALSEFADKNPQKFIDTAENKDLELLALIQRSVNYGVLTNPTDTSTYIYDNTNVIGHTVNEAIAYLKDSKNAKIKTEISAALKSKTSK